MSRRMPLLCGGLIHFMLDKARERERESGSLMESVTVGEVGLSE